MAKHHIGIFGGSFNPVTKGHVKVAESVLEHKLVDAVWFMPCYNHNFGKLNGWPYDRIEMLYFALKGKKNIDLCTYEIISESEGKMYDTMIYLSTVNPNTNFSIIIGMDCALEIEKWYNWQELIKTYPFIVMRRFGYDLDYNQWFSKFPHIIGPDISLFDYSSTLARKAIAENDNDMKQKLLDQDVINFIEKNGLYR